MLPEPSRSVPNASTPAHIAAGQSPAGAAGRPRSPRPPPSGPLCVCAEDRRADSPHIARIPAKNSEYFAGADTQTRQLIVDR